MNKYKYKIINTEEPFIYYKVVVEKVDFFTAVYSIEIYEDNDRIFFSSFFDSVDTFLKSSNGCFEVQSYLHFCSQDDDFNKLTNYIKIASHIGDLLIEPYAVVEYNNWLPNGYSEWIFKRENWIIEEIK